MWSLNSICEERDGETKIGSSVFWWISLMMFSFGVTLFRKSHSMHTFNALIQMQVWKSYIRYNYLSLATLEPWIPITQYLMVLGKAHNWNDLCIWLFLLQAYTHHSLLYNVGSCHHKNINIFHLLFRLTILNITMSTSALPTKSLFGLRF